jgi:hypothetical protein
VRVVCFFGPVGSKVPDGWVADWQPVARRRRRVAIIRPGFAGMEKYDPSKPDFVVRPDSDNRDRQHER